MNSIFPEWLVGNSEARYYSGSSCSDLSSFRQPTEDELKEFYRHQAEGARAMTADDIAKWHCRMTAYGHVVENRMKDKKDSPIPVPNCMPPPRAYRFFDSLKVELTKEESERLHNSTRIVCNEEVQSLFKKLCTILSAAYKWLFGLLTVKK